MLMLLAGCRNPLVVLTLVVVRNSAADNFRGRRIAWYQRRRPDLLPNSDQTVLHRRQGKADLGSCPSNKGVLSVSQDVPCVSWLFRQPRGLRLAHNRFCDRAAWGQCTGCRCDSCLVQYKARMTRPPRPHRPSVFRRACASTEITQGPVRTK
ncbi:hypothetical protein EDB83DRAFT_1433456 [Lactarius deliciosus]|nr:hypothetical protein EDB83DRAFT_1433456 [Lactarius deliciosus]